MLASVAVPNSVLFLGRPGVGKTTVIREMARVLSDELHKRVVIVDTSNEIGGDGDVPHPAIGGARRMQVPDPSQQHKVMVGFSPCCHMLASILQQKHTQDLPTRSVDNMLCLLLCWCDSSQICLYCAFSCLMKSTVSFERRSFRICALLTVISLLDSIPVTYLADCHFPALLLLLLTHDCPDRL